MGYFSRTHFSQSTSSNIFKAVATIIILGFITCLFVRSTADAFAPPTQSKKSNDVSFEPPALPDLSCECYLRDAPGKNNSLKFYLNHVGIITSSNGKSHPSSIVIWNDAVKDNSDATRLLDAYFNNGTDILLTECLIKIPKPIEIKSVKKGNDFIWSYNKALRGALRNVSIQIVIDGLVYRFNIEPEVIDVKNADNTSRLADIKYSPSSGNFPSFMWQQLARSRFQMFSLRLTPKNIQLESELSESDIKNEILELAKSKMDMENLYLEKLNKEISQFDNQTKVKCESCRGKGRTGTVVSEKQLGTLGVTERQIELSSCSECSGSGLVHKPTIRKKVDEISGNIYNSQQSYNNFFIIANRISEKEE